MYHKVTGHISERHPFHDYMPSDVYDFDVASIDKQYEDVRGFGCSSCRMGDTIPAVVVPMATLSTIVPWFIVGLGAYFLFLHDKKKRQKQQQVWGGDDDALFAASWGVKPTRRKKAKRKPAKRKPARRRSTSRRSYY